MGDLNGIRILYMHNREQVNFGKMLITFTVIPEIQ